MNHEYCLSIETRILIDLKWSMKFIFDECFFVDSIQRVYFDEYSDFELLPNYHKYMKGYHSYYKYTK